MKTQHASGIWANAASGRSTSPHIKVRKPRQPRQRRSQSRRLLWPHLVHAAAAKGEGKGRARGARHPETGAARGLFAPGQRTFAEESNPNKRTFTTSERSPRCDCAPCPVATSSEASPPTPAGPAPHRRCTCSSPIQPTPPDLRKPPPDPLLPPLPAHTRGRASRGRRASRPPERERRRPPHRGRCG